MPGRNFLFVPGPSNVPDRILRAMHRPMEDHRSSSFPALVRPILEDLKKVFATTSGQTFVFPATGTGMWETALVNTLSPGDRVLAPRFGQFSHLFIDCAQRLGLTVDVLQTPWGEGAPVEQIEAALKADRQHQIKGVLVVHNETSTGVTSDIPGVRKAIDAAQHPALLYVDSVSGLGSLPFEMDAWGVDAAITGSQKGFMLPAGLGILAMSQRALALREHAKCARVFFDLGDMGKANATGYFPYTPSIPLLYGLRESLDMLFEEGLDHVYARHHRLAEGCRKAVAAWGLALCAKQPKWNSDTVSAIMVPAGINGADVIDVAFRRYDLALGAGLSEMAGKLFRIGHLGDLNELMLLGALAGAEMAMRDVGIKVTLGSGVAAAQEYYRSTALPLPGRDAAAPPKAQAGAVATGGTRPGRDDAAAGKKTKVGA
jgi:alanine-glyoxylate transaminase/serine-glyoxylate transaminase/serine-pyruvate transaminase